MAKTPKKFRKGIIGISTDPDRRRSHLEEVFNEVRNWMVLGGPYTEYRAKAVKKRLSSLSGLKEYQVREFQADEDSDWYVYYFEGED